MGDAISIEKVNSESLGNFLDFFDHDAFADNPNWAGCYCYWFYADHKASPWDERAGEEHRAEVIKLIRNGQMRGYLAYADGRPVAWCNAAPRMLIPALRDEPDSEDPSVGAIVCFVVAKPFRGLGIAARLLETACADFRRDGLKQVEAYPRKEFKSEASSYHGPLELYLAAGFKPYCEDPNGQIVVRKALS